MIMTPLSPNRAARARGGRSCGAPAAAASWGRRLGPEGAIPAEIRLSREMGLLDVTMIGVGAMIGAGIFVLTGIAAGVAGPALLLVFFLNGIVALLTAMTYAELGSAFHDAGGGYLWVKSSLPDPNGFLSGWMSWFAHAVACSVYALGFGAYFRLVLEAAGVPAFHWGGMSLEKWLAAATTLLFAFINYRGASETGKAGNVVTVGKVAVILTFIAFEGYEIIAQTSEEVEEPKRNVPRAIFLSLLIVVPIYLLVALVAIGAVSPPAGQSAVAFLAEEKEIALVRAADQFVRGGGIVLLIGGLLSTVSALNATIYSSSRVAFAMARDANLPQVIGRVHAVRSTPHVAVALSAVIVIGMALLLPIEDVAAATDVMFLLLFVQVNVAVIRLRRRRPDLDRGFRVPLMPVVPVVAIAAMLFLAGYLFTHYPLGWVAVAGWLLIGAGVYYGYSRKRERAHEERERWMERIERKEHRVLVALSSPRTMRSLLEAAIAIAQGRDSEIVVVTVAEVPEGESLMAGRRLVRELEPLLDEARAYATERGVPARAVLKIDRRVSHGILQTVWEEECNFLVLGRPVTSSLLERLVGSIVERVLQNAPCRVGVVYGSLGSDGVRGVVVPVTAGANARLAAELAPAFGRRLGVPVRAVTVVPPELTADEASRLVAPVQDMLAGATQLPPLAVVRARDVIQGLVATIAADELVVIGAPSTDPVAALVGQTVPGTLAALGRNPVIVVRDIVPQRAHRFERFFLSMR